MTGTEMARPGGGVAGTSSARTCPAPSVGEICCGARSTGNSRDRLTCSSSSCGLVLDDDVALTRKSLQERPPDVLFTTTEMLSRHASAPWAPPRLAIGRGQAPRLVLLDEVHTYSGVHGAQVALLLRRWRHSVRPR